MQNCFRSLDLLACLLLGLMICLIVGGPAAPLAAAQDDVQRLRANAIRQAVQRVAASVVSVERMGASGEGELASDAPTSAVAVDDQRHFLASSIAVDGDPATILLVSATGDRAVADVVARDRGRQLVLLRARQTLNVPPLPRTAAESSAALTVGQTVIAVGRQSSDQSLSISHGILSATGRNWGLALQTDARVSAPYYGGPLIDLYGRVLGVIVPMAPDGGAAEDTGWYDSGVAFAIDMPSIWQRLPTLTSGSDIRPGLAGIVASGSDPYVETASIAAVRPRSPAEAAGLLPGDAVVAINDTPIRSHREIKQTLGPLDAGTSIVITVKRGAAEAAETVKVPLTLTDSIPPLVLQRLGITAAHDPQTQPPVVIRGVVAGSPAAGKLQVGDRIASIGSTDTQDLESLRRQVMMADPDRPLVVHAVRDGSPLPPIEITTAAISLLAAADLPAVATATDVAAEEWTVRPWKVGDLANAAVVVAPASDRTGSERTGSDTAADAAGATSGDRQPLGLLMLLVPPGTTDLAEQAARWQSAASAAGVVVCLVAPIDEARWTPDEIEVAQRLAASLRLAFEIDTAQQAISGSGPGATLAMASAMARPGSFAGLAVAADTRPPRMRLRENDPAAALQLLITGQTPSGPEQSGGGWPAALRAAGYTVLEGSDDPAGLLAWVRSLAVI